MTVLQQLISQAKKEHEESSGTQKTKMIKDHTPKAPKDWKTLRMGKRLTKAQLVIARRHSDRFDPMAVPSAK